MVLADGDLIANIPMDEVVKAHEESGNDITMVVTKHAAEISFSTYCELNRKREIVDIRVGNNNDGKCKYSALGVYVMSRQYLIHLIADCVTHNYIHFERELLARALTESHIGAYVFSEYNFKVFDAKDYFQANMDILDKECRNELFCALVQSLLESMMHSAYYGG